MSKLVKRIAGGELSTGKNQARSWVKSVKPEFDWAMEGVRRDDPKSWEIITAYVYALHAQSYWSRQD